MYNASAWEAQTRELISRIEHEMEELQADTARKLALFNRKKAALEESLVTFREMMYMEDKAVAEVLTPDDVRDKSQKDILVLIATRNNGLLVANQAIKLMKEAGVFGNPENASSAVYSVLKRATREFDRVGQGVYKLRDWSGTGPGGRLALLKDIERPPADLPESEDEETGEDEGQPPVTELGTAASAASISPNNILETPAEAPVSKETAVTEIEKDEARPEEEAEDEGEPETAILKDASWIDNIELEAVRLMPETIARRYNAIPVSLAGNTLIVAMANPYDIYAIEAFTTHCHKHVTPIAATLDEIRKAIDIYYKL